MLLIAMVSRDILVACGSLIEGNPDARNLKRRLGQPRKVACQAAMTLLAA